MKFFIIFATIFIVGICADESNTDISSGNDENGESALSILAKILSWSQTCVTINGKTECKESSNNGDGPTKTKTYSDSGHSNDSPFKDFFGNSPHEVPRVIDMLRDLGSLLENNQKRSSRSSNIQSSQNSQSARNMQRTQSKPNQAQGSRPAQNSRKPFNIVKANPENIPGTNDDILI